ncbi:MAG: hypothetical protein COB60_12740 [Flavobacteriaceae bacterium]|nr:MAG: hypothetical protein COB60_12740 [Flavobacteriaceae bacterium]
MNIKNVLSVAVVAIVISSCSHTKIGYMDVEKVMTEYEGMKDLEVDIIAQQEILAKNLDSLSGVFQDKVKNYYAKSAKMTSKKRQEVEAALQMEQQMLQGKQQQATLDLQKIGRDNTAEITQLLDSLVTVYATKNGYHLIMGTTGKGTVMYGDESLNVTDQMLDIMNTQYKK